MKNEAIKATLFALLWLLVFGLLLIRCVPADAQTVISERGSRRQYTNGYVHFDRTITITTPKPAPPPSPYLLVNPYYTEAVKKEADEVARRCVKIIVNNVDVKVWEKEFRSRMLKLPKDIMAELHKGVVANERDFDALVLKRLIDEAEMTLTLRGAK